MKNRILDKIKEIELFLEEINSVLPISLKQYKKDFKIRAVCERYFEKIVEAVVDLVFLTIKEQRLQNPEEDKTAFDILYNNKIIPKELCEKLKCAKGMRNILSHQYGNIHDELVFEAITEQLDKDVRTFIASIEKLF